MKPETLHDAAKLGDKEAAETLIAEGAEVNAKDARGITPLGVAVRTPDRIMWRVYAPLTSGCRPVDCCRV